MIDYFKNFNKQLIRANDRAFRYGDGVAWNNVKRKNMKRYAPRGRVFMRLERLESHKWYDNLRQKLVAGGVVIELAESESNNESDKGAN